MIISYATDHKDRFFFLWGSSNAWSDVHVVKQPCLPDPYWVRCTDQGHDWGLPLSALLHSINVWSHFHMENKHGTNPTNFHIIMKNLSSSFPLVSIQTEKAESKPDLAGEVLAITLDWKEAGFFPPPYPFWCGHWKAEKHLGHHGLDFLLSSKTELWGCPWDGVFEESEAQLRFWSTASPCFNVLRRGRFLPVAPCHSSFVESLPLHWTDNPGESLGSSLPELQLGFAKTLFGSSDPFLFGFLIKTLPSLSLCPTNVCALQSYLQGNVTK